MFKKKRNIKKKYTIKEDSAEEIESGPDDDDETNDVKIEQKGTPPPSPRSMGLMDKLISPSLEMCSPFQLSTTVRINQGTRILFNKIDSLEHKRLNCKLENEGGNLAIHWAALLGQVEVLKSLVFQGAKINSTNDKKITPLHFSCSKMTQGHLSCCEVLLHYGAKMNVKDELGRTPLHWAVLKGPPRTGNVPCLSILLRFKPDVNVRDIHHRTPLHYAVESGQIPFANLLIEKGKANITPRDSELMMPCHLAIVSGNIQFAHLLSVRGAFPLSALTSDGSTCFHLCAKHGRTMILDNLLLTLRRDPSKFPLLERRDKRGFTCFHWLGIRGDVTQMKYFPQLLDVPDHVGLTPVLWAYLNGFRSCVLSFLAKGAQSYHEDFGDIWTPMADDMLTGLQDLRNSIFSDLTLVVGRRKYRVHKCIVGRILKKIIETTSDPQMLTLDEPCFKHSGKLTYSDFEIYLYTGKIPPPKEKRRLQKLAKVAQDYGLPLLRQHCENRLLQTPGAVTNQRLSTLPLHLQSILKSGDYSDCCVIVDGKKFRLHKFVLASRCPYFAILITKEERRVRRANAPAVDLPKLEEEGELSENGEGSKGGNPEAEDSGTGVGALADQEPSFEDLDSPNSKPRSELVLTVSSKHLTKGAFSLILEYIYGDVLLSARILNVLELLELLEAATFLKLEKFVRRIEYYLYLHLTLDNLTAIHGETSNLPLIQRACTLFIVKNFDLLKTRGTLISLGLSNEEILAAKKASKSEKIGKNVTLKKKPTRNVYLDRSFSDSFQRSLSYEQFFGISPQQIKNQGRKFGKKLSRTQSSTSILLDMLRGSEKNSSPKTDNSPDSTPNNQDDDGERVFYRSRSAVF